MKYKIISFYFDKFQLTPTYRKAYERFVSVLDRTGLDYYIENPKLNKELSYFEITKYKPKFIKKRRYYTSKQIEVVKLIKFLLKDKGMTVKGVKKILNDKINKLDDYDFNSLKTEYFKINIKNKSKNILAKINKLKKYGKKNSH